MRFLIMFFLFIFFCCDLYSQNSSKKRFSIRGKYEGKKISTISFSYRDSNEKWVTKDCEIINGTFSLSGNISSPTTMAITSKLASPRMDDPNWVEILIEPGTMSLSLEENNFKSLKVIGSSIQDALNKLEESKSPIYTKSKPLVSSLNILNDSLDYFLKLNDSVRVADIMEKRKLIFNQMDTFRNIQNQIELKYVAEHPNDYLSAYLLEKQYVVYHFDVDSAKYYSSKFSDGVRNSYWTKSILLDIERKKGSSIGAAAKDFIIEDSKGLKISLSSFHGKNVTILDFWASWCIPCRDAIPHLKTCYNKYKKAGLVVIAITEDKDKEAWLNAIQQDSTNDWYHVAALKNKENIEETDIGKKYETTPIPICYLINKQGIIVGKWLGQGDENNIEIDKKLKELFKF